MFSCINCWLMIHLFCKAKHIFEDLAEDYLSPDGKVVLPKAVALGLLGLLMQCCVSLFLKVSMKKCTCSIFSNGKEVIHSSARRRFRKHKHDKVGWAVGV